MTKKSAKRSVSDKVSRGTANNPASVTYDDKTTEQRPVPVDLMKFGTNSMLSGDQQMKQAVNPAKKLLAEMTRAAKHKAVSAAYELGGVLDGGLQPREQLVIPGLYFGHRPGDTRWSLVIQIEGVAPFFTMVVFDRDTGLSARVVNPEPANYLLGPKIDVPGFCSVHSEL